MGKTRRQLATESGVPTMYLTTGAPGEANEGQQQDSGTSWRHILQEML